MFRYAIALALTLVACGGNQAASPNTTSGAQKAGLLRLGHYSAANGMLGFVLDRTSSPPKLKMDGGSEIITLEVVKRGQSSYDLVNHDKHIGIAVSDDGGVSYSKKGEGIIEMYLDRDAQPL